MPALDFLYPPQTQEFLATCLVRPPKRLAPRRRKNVVLNPTRSYSSESDGANPDDGQSAYEREIQTEEKERQALARKRLALLFDHQTQKDYAAAWSLYDHAGRPPDVIPALLKYMCLSTQARDQGRIKRLFDALPVESRTEEDYFCMAVSYLNIDSPFEMKLVVQEALANGVGTSSWGLGFAQFLKTERWSQVQQLWDQRPQTIEGNWLPLVSPYLDVDSLPETMLNLAAFAEDQSDNSAIREYSLGLLDYLFESVESVENITTETLLLLSRQYGDLDILKAAHYFRLIETLASSTTRATFIKSIVVYRQFRWQVDSEAPPISVLRCILKGLYAFHITNGVRYILDEFTYFHGRPWRGDYKWALTIFARAGDVSQVNQIFEMLVKQHGKELSRKLLTPLLYVHARVGNVADTLAQFQRVSEEFNREPNTVCWNILLTAYSKSDDFTGTLSTFEQMLKNGVEPDSYTFGILMGICANRGDIDSVLRLLTVAKERQVEITAPMLDPIVETYCNNQLHDLAEQVAEACVGLQVKGSMVRMWNLLLWNHAFRLDLDAVSRLHSRMEAIGIRPDGMTYAAFMLSLVLVKKTDAARRVLRSFHRSRRIQATQFHYAIILYGYVKARNAEMVDIIFNEIKERFDQPSFSSNLLMLRDQVNLDLAQLRDEDNPSDVNRRLEQAENFLMEAIRGSDTAVLASKYPSPGTHRQSRREAFPAMYYEALITAYGTIGSQHKVEELFEQFTHHQQELYRFADGRNLPPLRLLAVLMHTHLTARQFDKVEECWLSAFPRSVKMASRIDIDEWLSARLPSEYSNDLLPPPLPNTSQNEPDSALDPAPSSTPPTRKPTSILPSCRFLLSRPLSTYIRALSKQRRWSRIVDVMSQVEDAGFTLTTFNLTVYVQVLATSALPQNQLKAFALFEETFMPSFPGWEHCTRGRALKPREAPLTSAIETDMDLPSNVFSRADRNIWVHLYPDFMIPTYNTMLHLAGALGAFRSRSVTTGNDEIKELYKTAPRTIDALADMPFAGDKIKEALQVAREGQSKQPPVYRSESYEPYVWPGGILGIGDQGQTDVGAGDAGRVEDEAPSETQTTADDSIGPTDEPQADPVFDPQDVYDISIEQRLEAQRRAGARSDDELDTGFPAASEPLGGGATVESEDGPPIQPSNAYIQAAPPEPEGEQPEKKEEKQGPKEDEDEDED